MIRRFLFVSCLFAALLLFFRWFLKRKKRKNTIGIFHLYCSSGGGGERVLWHTVKILLEKYPKYSIYIYTHSSQHDHLQILLKARSLFQIDLISDRQTLERIEFIPLILAPIVENNRYPFLTLFLQNFMSIFVAIEASYKLIPEIYIETIGFTYTLPVFKLFDCTVITYVHYPTISSDMIEDVQTSSHASFNNREVFVRRPFLRQLKLVYYRLLAYLYGFAGRRADLVMVNSTWTRNHIESLWQTDVYVVYPPCDVKSFQSVPLERYKSDATKDLKIVSIAQFRPEKNHELQIEAFDIYSHRSNSSSELTIFGGCRDERDQKRVDYLADLICRLDLGSRVRLITNASFETILEGVQQADIAVHTMKNEHFGIVLLEFMAAGLITVAHNSGGPKLDIIDDGRNGFLCDSVDDFADKLMQISRMSSEDRNAIRLNATKKANKFSIEVFESTLLSRLDKFFSRA